MKLLSDPNSKAIRLLAKLLGSHRILAGYCTRLSLARFLKTRHLRNDDSMSLLSIFRKTNVAHRYFCAPEIRPAQEFSDLCHRIQLSNSNSKYFYYSIDPFCATASQKGEFAIGNVTIGYKRFLEGNFRGLEKQIQCSIETHGSTPFLIGSFVTVNAIKQLAKRILNLIEADSTGRFDNRIIHAVLDMDEQPAQSFHGALQRVLFLNQLLWQCGHLHNGLGRLDQDLFPYYERDLENGTITKEVALELIRDFIAVLHEDYAFKSADLLGDSGQIIILGGSHENASDACNPLTELFLLAVGSSGLTEPKILFRVSSHTPRYYLDLAIECLRGRTGSPLFSNDDIIVPILIQFGYSATDAFNYGSAACWEPLIPGRSLDQGNIGNLNFLSALSEAIETSKMVDSLTAYEELIKKCESILARNVCELVARMNLIPWKPAPLMSLFMDECIQNNLDISNGGAIYNNYGFTTVGLGNLVDSLLNLKSLLENSPSELIELYKALRNNYQGYESLQQRMKDQAIRFGCDVPEVIDLANRFTQTVQSTLASERTRFGGKFKFGLSSPYYVSDAITNHATPDGRTTGDPLLVHISGTGKAGSSYTDLLRFSGQLEYSGHRFNGNVADFVVDPSIVEAAENRFRDFLEGAVRCNFFQMQMTLVDSKTILKAIEHPKLFPNLIVRVWGFSAYFKDLPEDYRRVVLERTLRSEAACR